MSNTFWTQQPKWGDLGAWEIATPAISNSSEWMARENLARSGRRTWDLKFSYMDDGDLFGSNQLLSIDSGAGYYETGGDQPHTVPGFPDSLDSDDYIWDGDTWSAYTHNLLTDDNFFSQVWSKTLGPTLPFIFQPNKDNQNPDGFAIARFKENSLKATRSSFNTYDISLKIEEVW